MTLKGDNQNVEKKSGILKPGEVIAIVCIAVAFLDQITKLAVIEVLSLHEDRVIIDGFFKLVYWGNTGAAWSLFRDNNELLTVISLIALLFLFIVRNKFETNVFTGKIAMGMIFGGIIGNITDRLIRGHVVDFLYFYLIQRSGNEIGFPAFNLADLSICLGVGMMVILIMTKKEDEEIAGCSDERANMVSCVIKKTDCPTDNVTEINKSGATSTNFSSNNSEGEN